MNELNVTRQRVQSIDVLRGLVMVVMALDHVRDFLYTAGSEGASGVALDPTNMQTTFPALFFTRWITHFCAPIFVFLAGTSVYLMSQRKSKKEVSLFLLTRGLWLLFVEVVIITFGWTFNPGYNFIVLQVIWAIAASMIVLGFVVLLPYRLIFAIGLIIVAGHNLMDYSSVSSGLKGSLLSNLLYFSNFSTFNIGNDHLVVIVYSFLPWTGVMMLGYCFGKLYRAGIDPVWRRKKLLQLGIGLVVLFIILRFINLYGDPLPWSSQPRGTTYTILSFLNLNKYPPSLLFLCMTTGPGLIFLALIENIRNGFTKIMNVYGRVPMFYYILHFYVIHLIVVVIFFATSHGTNEIVPKEGLPFYFKADGMGFNLWGIYATWLFVVIVLYPACKKYDQYKTKYAGKKWWLSYL
jgi:uncharacterized membrane protein